MNINLNTEQISALTAKAAANNKTPEAVIIEWVDILVAEERRKAALDLDAACDAHQLTADERVTLKQEVMALILAKSHL